MANHPDVLFVDRVRALRVPKDEQSRRLNTCLAHATQACDDILFDGTAIRLELYHLRHPERGSSVDWHRHPFTELTWVEGGSMTYEHADTTITLRDGEFFLMPPFLPHRWRASSRDTVLHGFMLTVMPTTDRRHTRASHVSAAAEHLGYRLPKEPSVSATFQLAEASAMHDDALGMEAAAAYLRAGLARLFRTVVSAAPSQPSPEAGTAHTDARPVVERAVAFIASQLTDPLDVSAVAQHVGLSTRQLDRLFHAAFDMPTGGFILHTRLERACYLLRNSDLSIKQVARACGFPDPNYFSRVFRQRRGEQPGQYRRQV